MLDSESREKMAALFGGASDEPSATTGGEALSTEEIRAPDTNPEQNPSPPAADKAGETAPPAADDAGNAETPAVSDTPKADDSEDLSQHRVKYDRFKKVVDARNEAKSRATKAEQQLAELQTQFDELKAQPKAEPKADPQSSSDNWLDDILKEDGAQPEQDDQRYSQLDTRLARFEMAQAQKQLDAEVAEVQTKYPGVSEQVLYKAVARNPDVNLMQLGESLSTRRAAYEEQVIARYVAEQAKEAPAVPPRPSGKSSVGPVQDGEGQKPKTLADASSALRQMLSRSK